MFLILFIFLFIPEMEVKASSSMNFNYYQSKGDATRYISVPDYMFCDDVLDSKVIKDDLGRHKSGYFYYCGSTSKFIIQRDWIFNSEDGFIYLTKEEITDNSLDAGLKKYKFKVWCSSSLKNVFGNGDYLVSDGSDGVVSRFGPVKDLSFSVDGIGFASLIVFVTPELVKADEIDFYCTTFPVFDVNDKEGIEKYKTSGDYSSAENSDFLANEKVEFDESIEMPQGLKCVGGFADGYTKQTPYGIEEDIILEWMQKVDTSDYIYTVDMKLTIEMLNQNIKDGKPTGEKYSTDWLPFNNGSYKGATSITRKFRATEVENLLFPAIGRVYQNATGKSGLPYKGYYINQIVIRVRNVSGSKCSNYVVVKIDRDGSDVTATVENEDEETVPDDQYNGDSVLDKPEVNGDLSSFSDILIFIKNGFGLFGSNGLIAMFRSFFSFLPEMWWTLILLGLGLIIFIGIINFLLKR